MTVIRAPHFNLRNIRGLILFAAVIGLLAVSSQLVSFIADLLWFEEVGYQNVFFITILAKLKAAVFFGTGFFIILYANLFLTVRLSSRIFIIEREDTIRIPSLDISNQTLQIFALIVSLILSLFVSFNGASQWESALLFFNAVPFGITDPLFQKDVGFYIFQLPFLKHIRFQHVY